MDLSYLKASDGTGEAVLAHVMTPRLVGATVLDLDNVDNWNSKVIVMTGTLAANGYINPTGVTVMYGTIAGSDLTIQGYAPSYNDIGNTTNDVAIIKQCTVWTDVLVDKVRLALNDDGSIKPTAADAAIKQVDTVKTAWISGLLPSITSITNNGNGSYDVIFSSTVAAILAPHMKLRSRKTAATNTYMGGAFNGSSHYFIKTTPTGTLATIGNNFSIKATIEPTAHQNGVIIGRSDAARNNVLELREEVDGRISVVIANGGSANYRQVTSYQSVPVNKKTRVWANNSSGTILIYFNGIAVPTSTTTSGTAPTTAGAGGSWAIGRSADSATIYFAGYISDTAVFDTVVAPSVLRGYDTKPLTGSEPNCIGAWSLNNTGVNQQSPGTNDMTASGGVEYTLGKSAYGTDSNNVSAGLNDFMLVMKVSGATATLQVPEGCTLDSTPANIAGIDVALGSGTPFGFPMDKTRWEIVTLNRVQASNTSAPTINVWYNLVAANTLNSFFLTVPIGIWELSYSVALQANGPTADSVVGTLSTANNSETDPRFTCYGEVSGTVSSFAMTGQRAHMVTLASQTLYYFNTKYITAGPTAIYNRGEQAMSIIRAVPAGI